MNILAQILGILGMASAIFSYQCKTNRNYFVFQGLCGLFFSLQFLIMGAWAGLLFNVYNIIRALVYQNKHSRGVWSVISLEILVFVIAGISLFAFKEAWWLVLFTLIGQGSGTFSMWTKNGKTIRVFQLALVSPGWLLYDLLIPTPSIGGILCEVFNMVSVIVSFVRFRKSGFDKT